MAAITPYPKYSAYQHVTSSDLISENQEVLEAIFPNDLPGGIQISVFLITSSAGKYTLLLGDALSFVDLTHSCDTLREICPVIFDCVPRSCSAELQQAVRHHGMAISGSPLLVALEIDLDTSNSFSDPLSPSYSGLDPQAELIRAISLQVGEVHIGKYRIKKIENTWRPPATRPQWQGLAFEQSDRMIYTWLHEANPNALQSARDEAQQVIDRTVRAQVRKQDEIQRQIQAGRYLGQVQEQLDHELLEIKQTLQERRNQLDYLTARTVNSAAHTTLQCAITMQIDRPDKIQLLERFVCQRIVTIIDSALEKVSWEVLQIRTVAIENFIRQKLNALEQRIPVLAERSAQAEPEWDITEDFQPVLTKDRGGTLTDWVHFRDEVMPDKQPWIRQTFQQFCQQEVGHPDPTPVERPELESAWKRSLSEKLKWVTINLRRSDEDFKVIEDHSFADIDITIFDAHRQQMVQVLRKGNQLTYGLGLELDEQYQERDFLHDPARHRQCVHLVKRITTGGFVYFGVTKSPDNPIDRPDPNSDFNEVHIPVFNSQNTFPQVARN